MKEEIKDIESLEKPKKKVKENLKQRAYLNSLTSFIDHGGQQLTGFIVSPIIVHGLGSTFYGIYQMLLQMIGFANMADTRATQVLKWSIASKRSIAEEEELRSEVFTAFIVTCFVLPFILLAGGVISWYAPDITNVGPEYYTLVRVACSLMILSLILHKVFDIFESVLRGMNLGYKRMGIRAGIIMMAGALKVLVIYLGYGIIGLSAVQIFVALITGLTFYFIVKKSVGWFGFSKTNLKKVINYSQLSGWFMAYSGAKMLLYSSDKIILGYMAGPVLVTRYTLTIFAVSAVGGTINSVINGVLPGIGSLFGKGEYEKVILVRKIIFSMNWLFMVAFGVAVIMLNKSFLILWTGEEFYAGNVENLLLVLVGVQMMFVQTDGVLINITLNLKMKVILTLVASLITIGIAFFLVNEWKIVGLAVSILIGRSVMTIGYPFIIKQKMKGSGAFIQADIIRSMLVAGLLFGLAIYISQYFLVLNWIFLFIEGFIIVLISGALFWILGLGKEEKTAIWEVVSNIKYFKKD